MSNNSNRRIVLVLKGCRSFDTCGDCAIIIYPRLGRAPMNEPQTKLWHE